MMKNLLLGLSIICLSTTAIAQVNKCYTDQALGNYINHNADQLEIYRQNEVAVQHWIAANKDKINNQKSNVVVTIPVVFHIVYKNATQNIADSNVYRQVDVLNECYRLMNTNFNQTRPIFDSIAADVEVEFCLATTDPSGNPTTGITRTAAPAGSNFDPLLGFDNVKSAATGGKDPWPNDQYLNVWVCDMSLFGLTIVLGYATFPGSDPALDGVVIQYQFIGYMPNPTTNNRGRTTVHEVGHWLGMRHIWGDGQGSTPLCDSTDYVDDTPNADTASQQTCLIKNTCSNESAYWNNVGIDPPDMIENYMDYSYDACMTMFTEGQKTRMLGFLNTIRASILTSPGCSTVGLNENNGQHSVAIYPNPTQGLIEVLTNSKSDLTLVLKDVTGRLVKEFEINQNRSYFNVADLASGVLFYEILDEGRSVQTGKLIKVD
jgi:hypothetical protein